MQIRKTNRKKGYWFASARWDSEGYFSVLFQCLRSLALKSPYGRGQGPRSGNKKNVDFEKNYKHFELKMESNMKGAKDPQEEGLTKEHNYAFMEN